MECGKASQKKEHGLTEKGNVVKNSVGIAMLTTEALLVKETATEKEQRRLFTNVISARFLQQIEC